MSQAWAHKLAPYSVNVNTLCPGLLYTPLWERIAGRRIKADPTQASASQRDVFEQAVKQSVPLGREQVPEDVGKAAAFLVSDRARNITGQALNVDGGLRKN